MIAARLRDLLLLTLSRKSNPNGLRRKGANMERKDTVLVMLTREEYLQVQIDRGVKATGYPHHKLGVKHYFWPWGVQDSSLARDTVPAAAQAFLEVYLPCEDDTWAKPKTRASA